MGNLATPFLCVCHQVYALCCSLTIGMSTAVIALQAQSVHGPGTVGIDAFKSISANCAIRQSLMEAAACQNIWHPGRYDEKKHPTQSLTVA